jgi:hypothetical protein
MLRGRHPHPPQRQQVHTVLVGQAAATGPEDSVSGAVTSAPHDILLEGAGLCWSAGAGVASAGAEMVALAGAARSASATPAVRKRPRQRSKNPAETQSTAVLMLVIHILLNVETWCSRSDIERELEGDQLDHE